MMEFQTVFDAGQTQYMTLSRLYDIAVFVVIFGASLGFSVCPNLMGKLFNWKRLLNKSEKLLARLFGCLGLFFAFISFVVLDGDDADYHKIQDAIVNGKYQVVEGIVQDFHPMPYSGHDTEHFTVNGVKFEYSDFDVTRGYSNTISHGGVVGDAMYVRISYMTNLRSAGNAIIKLEIPKQQAMEPNK